MQRIAPRSRAKESRQRSHANVTECLLLSFWFILLEERREPYTRLGVPGIVGELKAKWEKLGRPIRMVWARTGVRQKVLLCSSLELGQIIYALQVFGKFIKSACSKINWRWLIESFVCGVGSCKWLRWRKVLAGLAAGKHSFSKCWGAVLLASWKPSIADWYWRRDSSDGCWRVSNTSSWSALRFKQWLS